MFFAITLCDKTKLCIPAAWLQYINIVDSFNNVFKRHEKKIVFYSSNQSAAPNFLLPIMEKFDENIDSCYYAYVIKAFESKEQCIEYLLKRRAIVPPIYFPTAKDCDNNALNNQIEREIAMDHKQSIKREVDSLRRVLLNTNKIASIDLTDSDAEDFQNGIDEPVEIEEELSVLQEEDQTQSNPNDDPLSGSIPFVQNSVSFFKYDDDDFVCFNRFLFLISIDW